MSNNAPFVDVSYNWTEYGLQRLKKFHRGRLADDDRVIESPTLQQGWRLDATGNWQNFTQHDASDPAQTLDQTRVSNCVNEITQIARTVGPAWATPRYDRNGNMTVIPQPKQMTESYQATWDAWNRLVKLEEPTPSGGWQPLAEYQYDGQTWRTLAKNYTAGSLTETRHTYFSSSWQDLEERLGATPSSAPAERQFVWGLRYIDDLALRDRDSDADGTLGERLYVVKDGTWNTVAICDSALAAYERVAYFAYGKSVVLSSTYSVLASSGFEWEFLFAGYREDTHVASLAVRFRELHPVLGCWTRRDPIIDNDWNRYSYVAGNPLVFLDPLGLAKHHWFPQLGGEGQKFVDKLCCRAAPFNVDEFTTDLPNSHKNTPHYDVHHSCFGPSGYISLARTIFTTSKDCCDLLQRMSALSALAWACISQRSYGESAAVPSYHLTHFKNGGDTTGKFALKLLQAFKGKIKLDFTTQYNACNALAQEEYDRCVASGRFFCRTIWAFSIKGCAELYDAQVKMTGAIEIVRFAAEHPVESVIILGTVVIVIVVAANPEVWPAALPASAPALGKISELGAALPAGGVFFPR